MWSCEVVTMNIALYARPPAFFCNGLVIPPDPIRDDWANKNITKKGEREA